jgi:DNA-binding protein HU-beta
MPPRAAATPQKKASAPKKPGPAKGGPAKRAPAPKAPARRAKKAGPAATITLRQIAADLAEEHELPRKQVEALMNGLVEVVTDTLRNGDKVRLSGIGILQVKDRAARMGRNPATGEQIKIPASRKLKFTASKELKAVV